MNSPEAIANLMAKIRDKRLSIQSYIQTVEPRGNRLTTFNIICGAIATLLAALPAIGGQTVLDVFGDAGSNPALWRPLFGLVALFSLLSTIAANLYKSHDIASRLAKAQTCNVKLEGLATLLELGLKEPKEAATQYAEYLNEVPFVTQAGDHDGLVALDRVRGKIEQPTLNQEVGKDFRCAGKVEGGGAGCHLWLAVEIDGFIWPKERELLVDEEGRWEDTVYEQGSAGKFSISLYAANDRANRRIRAWLDRGDRTNHYSRLRRLPDTRRLQRVDGLHRTATGLHLGG